MAIGHEKRKGTKMRNVHRLGRSAFCAAIVSVVGYAALALSGSASARIGGPLCGYTTLWDCTQPNGTHTLVGGTVCDINKYQQQTGAHCVPSGL